MDGMNRVANLDALYDAFQKCKKGSDWKESVQKYEAHLWENLLQTRRDLMNGTYRQRPFVEFTIWERGRKRLIKSIHISDRVVQRSLCDNVLTPLVEPKLIYDNGASREGMGRSSRAAGCVRICKAISTATARIRAALSRRISRAISTALCMTFLWRTTGG